MTDKPDLVQRLMDFENHGTTALDRVNLREQAAIEIFMLRAGLQRIRSLNAAHDLTDAWKVAEEELLRSYGGKWPKPARSNLNSIDARLERMSGR